MLSSDRCVCVCVHARVCIQLLSHVQLFVTLWTVAHQAPLSMGFPTQEYWSGLPFPPAGYLPNPGIRPTSSVSPASQADSLPLSHKGHILDQQLENDAMMAGC